MIELRKISWKSNPAQLKDDIDNNFQLIASSFNQLVRHKLDNVIVDSISSQSIFLNNLPLSDFFLNRNEYSPIRIKSGENIVTAGTESMPTISVCENPRFSSLYASSANFESLKIGGSAIDEMFYSRKEMSGVTFPKLGDNLTMRDGKIHLEMDPDFRSIHAKSLTAITGTFNDIEYKGSPIQEWFGSHTFIVAGNNIATGGTVHSPIISIIDDPSFRSISSQSAKLSELTINNMTGVTIQAVKIISDSVSTKDGFNVGDDLHVVRGNVSIGCEPELEISSFLRTKLRIVAASNESIHNALLVQSRNRMVRRTLNDQSVDFVVKGDGNIGIGAYDGLSSKLTIRSEYGYDQLQLKMDFTPSGTNDIRGQIGNLAWNDDFVFLRTRHGWKRTALVTF